MRDETDLAAFLPRDRRHALATGITLPDRATGAVLIADLAGYTSLTEAFAAVRGPQRGAEEVTQAVNGVYEALIAVVHHYGGSVVGFSGDAFGAWFAAGEREPGDTAGRAAGGRAATVALALQAGMAPFACLPLPGGRTAALGVKVAVVAGEARRFVVGDPTVQRLDVLAGPAPETAGRLEALAVAGEVLVDGSTWAALAAYGPHGTRRADPLGGPRLGALAGLARPAAPAPWPDPPRLTPEHVRPWLLPAVWARLAAGGSFAVDLRPAVALFLRFAGLDYSHAAAGSRLDGFVRWVQAVLTRTGGSLLQLTPAEKGSYLYAAFGAPLAHPDDAPRAVAAALELCRPPPSLGDLQGVQIGLAAGLVRAGPYGGGGALTYGAVGDVVNVAARLMQHAAPGGTLATREVRAAAGRAFRWTAVPALPLKGKARPVPVYALAGGGTEPGLWLQEPGSGTPLIGRVTEIALLDTQLARARAGAGQIVAVVGEAGLGKSRLLAEGVRRARASGFATYGGAAQSYGAQSAYLAWRSVWQGLFALEPEGPAGEQAAQLARALAAVDVRLLPRLPLLGPLLGVALPDTDLTAHFDAKLRKESLEALLLDVLRARAAGGISDPPSPGAVRGAGRPLLLVLEDCQWLDPLSHDLLEAVGRAIADWPVLLLLAYRPPEVERLQAPRVAGLAHFTAVTLTRLPAAAAAALIAAHLGVRDPGELPPVLVEAVTLRAEGNPFFVEELLAYLAERGLDPQDAAALAGLDWPASLQSLLLARIDQLTEQQRTVIKVASLVGRRFRRRELWGVYPDLGAEPGVGEALAVLDHPGRTPLQRPAPEWAYLFRHIVTRDVAYGSLPFALRRQLHGQFATWLEAGSAAAGYPPPLDLLAYHFGQSADTAKQREYFWKAGDAAAAAYNNAAAVDYYERLLPLLEEQGARAEVLLALGEVLFLQGTLAEAAARQQAAVTLATTTGDPLLLARAHHALGTTLNGQGAYAEATAALERARQVYEPLALDRAAGARLADLMTEIGGVLIRQGQLVPARELIEAAVARAEAAGDPAAQAWAWRRLASVLGMVGELGTARTLSEQSVATFRLLGDRPRLVGALNELGIRLRELGERSAAAAVHAEQLQVAEQIGDRFQAAISRHHLGVLAWEAGDLPAARSRYDAARAAYQQMGRVHFVGEATYCLAQVACTEGNLTEAQARLEETLALFRSLGEPLWICGCLAELAWVAWAAGDHATAATHQATALGVAHGLGVSWRRTAVRTEMALLAALEGGPVDEDAAGAFLAAAEAAGEPYDIGYGGVWRGLIAAITGDQPRARPWLRQGLAGFAGVSEPGVGERAWMVLAWLALAAVLARDAPERAALLAGAAVRWQTGPGVLFAPREQKIAIHLRGLLSPADPAAWQAGSAAGQALAWDAAMALALEAPG